MARKALKKKYEPALQGEPNKGLQISGLGVVKPDGTVAGPYRFLLNPDTLSDTKPSNWVAHQVPGQAAPVYQWVSGGPRIVSFEALVTKDIREFPFDVSPDPNPQELLAGAVLNVIGSIASSLLGVALPPLSGLLSGDAGSGTGRELSIAKTLDFYRTLQKPRYDKEGKLEASPPLVVLYFGDTLGEEPNTPQDKIDKYSQLWTLTNLDIKITKWLPNLSPMEAMVSFQFAEYKITSTKNESSV
jgi:hypothetical protein